MDEALDKINLRVTNPRQILDNKMTNECHRHGIMETMFPPIDIHEKTTLESKKEDDINEHGSYCMNTLSNPCSHEKFPESICRVHKPRVPHGPASQQKLGPVDDVTNDTQLMGRPKYLNDRPEG